MSIVKATIGLTTVVGFILYLNHAYSQPSLIPKPSPSAVRFADDWQALPRSPHVTRDQVETLYDESVSLLVEQADVTLHIVESYPVGHKKACVKVKKPKRRCTCGRDAAFARLNELASRIADRHPEFVEP